MRSRIGASAVVMSVALGAAVGQPVTHPAAADVAPAPAVAPCSSGLVALTFDDGPSPTVTPVLLDLLESRRVPATFFVVGGRVDAAPWVVRDMERRGFDLANHSYRHEQLTRLADTSIRRSLARTRHSIVAAGGHPTSLMRPPYGLIDRRVRSVVDSQGLTPVLWTVDPRDWERISPGVVADRVLGLLRPRRRNVVLQHDGIANSPNSVRAVPRIVRTARQRGYCFARLGTDGRPVPPVPRLSVRAQRAGEATGLRFVLRLDRPTSRPTSVRVRTVGGTAAAGEDFLALDTVVRFSVGQRSAGVTVAVLDDALDERPEGLTLRLSEPRGLVLRRTGARGVIVDDDPPPRVSVRDAAVQEPAQGTVEARVVVSLSRPSGRWVRTTARTWPGTADGADFTPTSTALVFPPGTVRRAVLVTVHADEENEGTEQLTVRLESTTNAVHDRAAATVTVHPAD